MVHVYRLITENTIEEKILDRGLKKLYLDALVVQKGNLIQQKKTLKSDELKNMITFGAQYILKTDDNEYNISDIDIEKLIKIGKEKTDHIKSALTKAYDHNIVDFKMNLDDDNENTNIQTFNNIDYSDKNNRVNLNELLLNRGPRKNKIKSYSETEYYKNIMDPNRGNKLKPKLLKMRPFKDIYNSIHDFQFYTDVKRLKVLTKKKWIANEKKRVLIHNGKENYRIKNEKKKIKLIKEQRIEQSKLTKLRRDMVKSGNDINDVNDVILNRVKSISIELNEMDNDTEWENIEHNILNKIEFLSENEEKELSKLENSGFKSWNTKHFNNYIKCCCDYGKNNIDKISQNIKGKSRDEVMEYHGVFWKKYKLIKNWEKYINRINDSEKKRNELSQYQNILNKKVGDILKNNSNKHKFDRLKIIYEIDGANKISLNGYTKLFDTFVLFKVYEYGLSSKECWINVRKDILKSKLFFNNFVLRSKNINDIKKRTMKILDLMVTYYNNKKDKKKDKKSSKKNKKSHKKKRKNDDKNGTIMNRNENFGKRFNKKIENDLIASLTEGTVIEYYHKKTNKWRKCSIIAYTGKGEFNVKETDYNNAIWCSNLHKTEWKIMNNNELNIKSGMKRKKMDSGNNMDYIPKKKQKI